MLLLILLSNGLCQVSFEVRTNKAEYLVDEPVSVIVKVTNIGTESVGYSYCDGQVDLRVENAEKKQTPNLGAARSVLVAVVHVELIIRRCLLQMKQSRFNIS